mmetsp:Transcript_19563/g.55238  ORF Transcript_19563/g.55238 Transcript_19563/m.55238 type:complete len:245 (-) Transcript_19563:103-837(-)
MRGLVTAVRLIVLNGLLHRIVMIPTIITSTHLGNGGRCNLITAMQPNALARCRHSHFEVSALAKCLSSTLDRILDGVKDACAQEKRRFSDGLAAVHGEGIVDILHQPNVEGFWHVVECRDLVGARSRREQLRPWPDPCVIIVRVDNFFDGAPAHALDECTFDLADVDGRIDARSDIHQAIRSDRAMVAAQHVDFHLAKCDALREVVEGLSFPRILGDIGTDIIRLGRGEVVSASRIVEPEKAMG